jgi:isoquinoline 1-oxidoreductase alpha subunit
LVVLIVNGIAREISSSSDTPLLWVLRDELDLPGTRFGCGVGLCGCCTVHLNGHAVRSCVTPVGDLDGVEITTIEGLGAKGMHALQQAWIDLDVPQCGYCQSGQIMQAADLLSKKPQPDNEDIDSSMSGNLCRCGTYPRIRAAIKLAATRMTGSETGDLDGVGHISNTTTRPR